MNIVNDKEWLIKRYAISAGFFFGSSVKQRGYIRRKLAISQETVRTLDDVRRILDIRPSAWQAFINKASATGAVVREFNPAYAYHKVQGADPQNAPAPAPDGMFQREDAPAPQNESAVVAQLRADLRSTVEAANALEAQLKDVQKNADARMEAATKSLRDALDAAKQNSRGPVTVEFVSPVETRQIDRQHKTFPALLKRVMAGVNVYLVGPAGSGKTTAAEKVAEALGLKFGMMSVGPQTTKSDIFGFISASGKYVETEFRRCYEHGGLFLWDEIDAAHPGVLTSINAPLAGSICSFPDKMVRKHKDFFCIAAGNTFGTGPDRVYVGRNELDGASLDRFDFLEWGYDEGLELSIAETLWEENLDEARSWCAYIQQVRAAVAKLGVRHVVSPRATIHGIRLLRTGLDRTEVAETSLWKSMKPAERQRVLANLRG